MPIQNRSRYAAAVLAALLGAGAAFSEQTKTFDRPAPPSEGSAWDWLLPKGFQRNPQLEMTAFTEMTDAGRMLPPVSPQAPAYYVAHSGGYRAVGASAGVTPLGEAEVREVLEQALHARGFLPAAEAHPPTIAIIYTWGPYMFEPQGNEAPADTLLRNVLGRASLVGGDKFAADLSRVLLERKDLSETLPTSPGQRSRDAGLGNSDEPEFSAATGIQMMAGIADPVRLFTMRSARNEFLVTQSVDDCYYVVASAYEYRSLATKNKVLLWRTKMTVNATGVAQPVAVPNLIASSTQWLGRETVEPAVFRRRAVRSGHVDVGTPTVVEKAAAPAAR